MTTKMTAVLESVKLLENYNMIGMKEPIRLPAMHHVTLFASMTNG